MRKKRAASHAAGTKVRGQDSQKNLLTIDQDEEDRQQQQQQYGDGMGQARHSSEGNNEAEEDDEGDYGMGTALASDNRENE